MEFDKVTSLSDITVEKVLDFVSSVQNCKDHVVIILRAFLKHLYDKRIIGYRTANILEKLKTRPIKKLPSYYTPMEIMGIENSIDRRYLLIPEILDVIWLCSLYYMIVVPGYRN